MSKMQCKKSNLNEGANKTDQSDVQDISRSELPTPRKNIFKNKLILFVLPAIAVICLGVFGLKTDSSKNSKKIPGCPEKITSQINKSRNVEACEKDEDFTLLPSNKAVSVYRVRTTSKFDLCIDSCKPDVVYYYYNSNDDALFNPSDNYLGLYVSEGIISQSQNSLASALHFGCPMTTSDNIQITDKPKIYLHQEGQYHDNLEFRYDSERGFEMTDKQTGLKCNLKGQFFKPIANGNQRIMRYVSVNRTNLTKPVECSTQSDAVLGESGFVKSCLAQNALLLGFNSNNCRNIITSSEARQVAKRGGSDYSLFSAAETCIDTIANVKDDKSICEQLSQVFFDADPNSKFVLINAKNRVENCKAFVATKQQFKKENIFE